MTICAGMLCPDGIVLCADTMESIGSVHRSVEKLVELPIVSDALGAVVVCATEDGIFADALIERISESLSRCAGTFASARNAIENATLKYCTEQWKALDAASRDKPMAHMLIGLKTADDLRLVELSTPTIRTIETWEFIGYGRELGIYKAGQCGLKNLPTDIAAPIMAYIVDIVKNNVPNCGRATSLAILYKNGEVEHKNQDYIAKATQGYKSIEWLLNTWVFPFLPVIVTEAGEDVLSGIGKLGEPKSDWVEKIPGILQFLSAKRKSILAGEGQPELPEYMKIGNAFGGVKLAIDMITNSSRKLHELGLIESDALASVEAIYPIASEAAQLAQNSIYVDKDMETAQAHIKSLFAILTRHKLVVQTLEGQR